jgi:nitrate/TMAO reductase-like tetraheme cytochrome c subunit
MRTFANMMVLWCIPIIGQHLDGMATRIHRIQKLIDKIIETEEKSMRQENSKMERSRLIGNNSLPCWNEHNIEGPDPTVLSSSKRYVPSERPSRGSKGHGY